jgi:predicted metalloendopeptidase
MLVFPVGRWDRNDSIITPRSAASLIKLAFFSCRQSWQTWQTIWDAVADAKIKLSTNDYQDPLQTKIKEDSIPDWASRCRQTSHVINNIILSDQLISFSGCFSTYPKFEPRLPIVQPI